MLTQERLKEVLHYDPETGVFRWRVERGQGRIKPWQEVRPQKSGYVLIRIDYVLYKAHRLAWLYQTGEWPKGVIDHVNGNPSDNSFPNLRDVTQTVNMQNRKGPQANNRTGFLGVSVCLRKFKAEIAAKNVGKHLGVFDTPEEAHLAYLAAKRQFHEGNTL